ncbi:MAG: glycosyltransferase [Alphaproteobacteria bacterium]|nr:glycosyltransferase [Alphaproteobacteria bacterium]
MRIACIIPAYAQPALLAEAVESAMAQTLPDVAAIIVDDGCPMPETQVIARECAARHPGRVHILRQRNGGLSAARNAGIEHALLAFPTLRAVYMLDADNRIHRHFLARALDTLEASPEIGWAYPDIDDLGPEIRWGTGGPFLLSALLRDNFCEAGSLISRRMLDAGLRFDTSMRQGFEDAEFWLRATRHGFAGRHVPQAGFRYRRRAESMLAESERIRPALLEEMRRRNTALWQPHNLLRVEARDLPRHAIITAGEDSARITLDPAEGVPVPRMALRALLAAARGEASHHPAPGIIAILAPGTDALLRANGLLHAAFWRAALLLREQPAATLLLHGEAPQLSLWESSGAADMAHAVFMDTRTLLNDPSAVAACLRRDAAPRLEMQCATPCPRPDGAALADAMAEIALLPAPQPRSGWRRDWRTPLHAVAREVAARSGIGIMRPARPGGRQIGIVQPLHAHGGVERVLQQQARVLRAQGWTPHLVIAERNQMRPLPGLHEAYASVNFFPGSGYETWLDPQRRYFGAEVSAFSHHMPSPDAVGLLAGMDVVLNTHSLACHSIAGRLRRGGVRCLLGLHVVERDGWGMPVGQSHSALAYEHAYDGAVVISDALSRWCRAQGWPREKITIVRNAPGYDATMPPPGRDTAHRPLRALFLGRLDAQKGLERLAAIIRATRGGIDWRVVGEPVLDGAPPDLGLQVEPVVTAPAALDALYAWADVLLLPSHFEGVPLTILEAQRLGCVPIATDVGAVAEAVTDGQDGILLPNDAHCVPRAIVALRALDQDRARLAMLSRQAAERLATARWEDTMQPLLATLERLVPR